MMCFKYLLPYAFLLPIPSASPLFMLVFVVQLMYSVRPCVYCLGLLSVVFLSASPSSPFTTLTYPARPSGDAVPLTQPVRRSWFELNNGYWYDPVLHAFSPNVTIAPIAPIGRDTNDVEEVALPKGFLDLRFRGLGFVLDYGFARTEEGLRWEMADRQAAAGVLDHKEAEDEARDEQEIAPPADLETGSKLKSWRDRVMSLLRSRSSGGGSMLGDW